jgi:flagellar hook-length control protein FliK
MGQARFDLAERLEARGESSKLQSLAGAGEITGQPQALTNQRPTVEATTIKLSVPEADLQQLRPNGSTVNIRIEPEHLGPARLSLNLNHHGLTARVTVDSMAARTVVEHSLDQLTDQLSRAGVQVDRIEVALAGGDARERFFDRRPLWSQDKNSQNSYAEDELEIEQVTPAPTLRPAALTGINAGRVNLWA